MNSQVSSGRRLLRNTASPFAAQLFSRALTTGYYILQVRLLAADNLGNYIFAGIVQAYALTITDWGLGTMLTREVARLSHESPGDTATDVARREHEARLLFGRMLGVRLVLAVVAQLPFWLLSGVGPVANIWKIGENGAWALLFLGFALFPNALSASATAVYNAHERLTLPALIGVITALVTVALGAGLMLLGWGAAGLGVAALLATLFQAAVFWRLLSRDFFPPRVSFDVQAARLMLSSAFPLMINGLLISIFFRFDQIIIGAISPVRATTYENAYKVINVTQIIAPSLVLALFPRMARAMLHDSSLLVRQFRGAVKALLIVGLPIVTTTIVLAEPLIVFITFGKNVYLPDSAYALMILIFYLPLSFINGVAQYVLIAFNQQRKLTYAILAGAAFNVIANLIAVPLLDIYGAALVTVLSEIVLLVPFVGWTAQELGRRAVLPGPTGLRLLVAGAILGAITLGLFASGLNPLLCAVAGIVAYVALLPLLGVISDEERALLRRVLGRDGK